MTWNWLTITDRDGEETWSGEFYPEFLPGGSMQHVGNALGYDQFSEEQIAALRRGETVIAGGGAAEELTLTPRTVDIDRE
jgi:hypothetical protein